MQHKTEEIRQIYLRVCFVLEYLAILNETYSPNPIRINVVILLNDPSYDEFWPVARRCVEGERDMLHCIKAIVLSTSTGRKVFVANDLTVLPFSAVYSSFCKYRLLKYWVGRQHVHCCVSTYLVWSFAHEIFIKDHRCVRWGSGPPHPSKQTLFQEKIHIMSFAN